jgi:serine/threonine protein kinase
VLTEPHIIPLHDTGEIDGRLYLVMPIIERIDVQTVLAREGPMTPPRAVRVIQQLAAALNMAHRHGLVHRDIKPSNALMTTDEHIYLIDFGIAHDASATRMTQTGMMVGTFSYMAPERFLAATVGDRADVYALTCVLHECLTGARPFPGDSMEQQIAGHLTMEPTKPSGSHLSSPASPLSPLRLRCSSSPGVIGPTVPSTRSRPSCAGYSLSARSQESYCWHSAAVLDMRIGPLPAALSSPSG